MTLGRNKPKSAMEVPPNFMGIGVPKAGTTWLYELLKSPPRIWVPQRREVRFLNRIPERSLSWYERFFPSDEESYEAVGEVTPTYLYCNERQIEFLRREIPSARRFILILRNPVERVYSSYWFKRRVANIDETFREYLDHWDGGLEQSTYVPYVRRWLQYFEEENFLFLILEEDLAKPKRARRKIADFLNVDESEFPETAGTEKENERWVPVFGSLYAWATNFADQLRQRKLDWLVQIAKHVGAKRIFGKKRVKEDGMDPSIREELNARLLGQVDELETLVGRDLSVWRKQG